MNELHLRKILELGLKSKLTDESFVRLFDPEYHKFDITENQLKKETNFLQFEIMYPFYFKKGTISNAGVEIELYSECYRRVTVNVFYDSERKMLYNSVLISPYYTDVDYMGRKSIKQTAKSIYNQKDLIKYIKSIHKRFECPQRSIS